MKYLVCLKEKGEGCDYMIGCGMLYEEMESESIDTLLDEIDEYYGVDFEDIRIIPTNQIIYTIDTKIRADEKQAQAEKIRIEELERQEREELKRLKEKYG